MKPNLVTILLILFVTSLNAQDSSSSVSLCIGTNISQGMTPERYSFISNSNSKRQFQIQLEYGRPFRKAPSFGWKGGLGILTTCKEVFLTNYYNNHANSENLPSRLSIELHQNLVYPNLSIFYRKSIGQKLILEPYVGLGLRFQQATQSNYMAGFPTDNITNASVLVQTSQLPDSKTVGHGIHGGLSLNYAINSKFKIGLETSFITAYTPFLKPLLFKKPAPLTPVYSEITINTARYNISHSERFNYVGASVRLVYMLR